MTNLLKHEVAKLIKNKLVIICYIGAIAFSIFFAYIGVTDANVMQLLFPDYTINGMLGFIPCVIPPF